MNVLKTEKNFITKFVQFSKVALYVLATCMLAWLSANALINGNGWRETISGVCITFLRIGMLLMVAVFSASVGSFFERIFEKHKKAEMMVVTILAIIFLGVNLWWVSAVPYVMEGDQAVIWYNAVLNIENDFSMFEKGGQMFIYPQQQSLSFLYEMLFRIIGSTSYRVIGYLNASLAPLTLIFGYDCVKMSFGKGASVRFLPLMMLCLPYVIYAPYVYGDIPSIALTFILLWAILKAMKTAKKRYYIFACLIAIVALFCRMNVWICFIGITLGLSYHCFHKKSIKPLVFALAIVLCVSSGMSALKNYNASRANVEVSQGMPSVLWMAMGLQYSEYGAGYYNDYSKRIFEQVDYDRELASQVAKQEIKERIRIFMSDGYQTKLFFTQKMKMQWEDGLFESIKFTSTFGEDKKELTPVIASFYHGEGYTIIKCISEYMLCITYVFALIGALGRLFSKENIKKGTLLKDIPLIVFVGGFLFSIIWEAKARYMLPYYVLLHMYAAYGLSVSSMQIKIILNKFLFRKQTTEV